MIKYRRSACLGVTRMKLRCALATHGGVHVLAGVRAQELAQTKRQDKALAGRPGRQRPVWRAPRCPAPQAKISCH
jgi:hypothetical protein